MAKRYDEPSLRPAIFTAIIEGRSHVDKVKERLGKKCIRLPVTLNILKLIKETLSRSQWIYGEIRLFWVICTLAFSGGFRIHELLSKLEKSFDPAFTLLSSDIRLSNVKIGKKTVEVIQVRVKSPKEDRIGKDVIVDVYQSGGFACPVSAYKKWTETNPPISTNKPAFRIPNGTPLTGKTFNKNLRELLSNHLDYSKGKITSHKFRGGLASMLGLLGYEDEQIQAMGRWSSRSFEDYIKLSRTKRAKMAREMASLMSKHC